MKLTCFFLLGCLSIVTVHAQGTVNFANTTTTRFYTNDGAGNFGLMSGVNSFRIGLYAGQPGSAESDLQLVGTATNVSGLFAGRFNGGNPFTMPDDFPAHTTFAFQVRVWSFFAGQSFEEASTYPGSCFLGRTALGYATLGGGVTVPAQLFGTDPGQLGGLQTPPSAPQFATLFIEIPVPEPSSLALAAVGVLFVMAFFRRHALPRRQSGSPD